MRLPEEWGSYFDNPCFRKVLFHAVPRIYGSCFLNILKSLTPYLQCLISLYMGDYPAETEALQERAFPSFQIAAKSYFCLLYRYCTIKIWTVWEKCDFL
jgi:hypothetical protein